MKVGDLVLAEVKRIRKIEASSFVYDFSVPGYENFVAGWGVCCHNTYGPRMRAEGVYGRVVSRFIHQALNNKPITVFGDGTQTRCFCYVTDQIEGLLKLTFSEVAKGEVVNIGSDEEVKIIELAGMVKKLTNSNSKIEFCPLPEDDPLRRKPDINKAKRLLDWKPKIGLEEGLKRMIRWFGGRND